MKQGLENREEFLNYKKWFKETHPNLPFMLHPNFVIEYNETLTVCAMCRGTGVIGNGPTSFNPQPCSCQSNLNHRP